MKYVQRQYTSDLLSRILKANQGVLSKLEVSQKHELPIPLQENIALSGLADHGIRNVNIAWPVFEALWTELMSKEVKRPPILLTLDGIANICRYSEYLTRDMHYIHSFDLSILDHFIGYLSGQRTLSNGGIVLASEDMSTRPTMKTLDLVIRQIESQQMEASGADGSANLPLYDPERPYDQIDPRVLKALRTANITRIERFSRDEVRSILQYYAQSGLLKETVTERFVTEMWSLAGGGNVSQVERGSIRMLALPDSYDTVTTRRKKMLNWF